VQVFGEVIDLLADVAGPGEVVATGDNPGRAGGGDARGAGGVGVVSAFGELEGAERDAVAVYRVPVGDGVPVRDVDTIVGQ